VSQLIDRQATLLTNAINILRGAPDPLSMHSHHDIAEVAAAVVSERDTLLEALAGPDATPAGRTAVALLAMKNAGQDDRFLAEQQFKHNLAALIAPGVLERLGGTDPELAEDIARVVVAELSPALNHYVDSLAIAVAHQVIEDNTRELREDEDGG
jgi:hypothetical protein